MRISKTLKALSVVSLVCITSLSFVGCNKKEEAKTETKEQVKVQVSVSNAIKITEPFAHLLTLEGLPEDVTVNNTFIMPDNVKVRIKVEPLELKDMSLYEVTDENGNKLKQYNDEYIYPLETAIKQEIVTGEGENKHTLELYVVEFNNTNMTSNKVYLIPKKVEDFFTPTDLQKESETVNEEEQ